MSCILQLLHLIKTDNFSSNSHYMSFFNWNWYLILCIESFKTHLRYLTIALITGWCISVVYWLSENPRSRGNNSRRYINNILNTLCHIRIFCIVIFSSRVWCSIAHYMTSWLRRSRIKRQNYRLWSSQSTHRMGELWL